MCTDCVDSTSTLLTTVYIIWILFFLSFSDFLVIILLINTLENVHIPCKQCTNMVDHDLHLSLHFFLISFWFSEYICMNYHIRKCAQTMYTIPQHDQQVHIMSLVFSGLFANYLIIFAWIIILGSVHDHVNSTPTSSPPSIFFSDFITIFNVKMQHFSYLAFFSSIPVTGFWCHSGDQTPSTVPLHVNDSLDHIYSFLPALSWFFSYICINYYIWKWADHINGTPTLSRTVHMMSIIFPDFFWFSGYTCINYYI